MNIKHDKQAILEQGEQILRKQGYHNTGINQILKECKIPKGSFYNFFNSKEEFGLEVLKLYGDNNLAMMAQFLESEEQSPLKRLKNFYEGFFQANQSEGFRYGCLVNNFTSEIGGQNETLRQMLDRQYNRFLEMVINCLQEAQALGEVRTDYPADELGEYVHGHFMGVLNRLKSAKNSRTFDIFYAITFDFLTKK
ncbi:hypothetical protein BKI52_26145 [marine bacterium AO1-C]|nr:hypothetical protein BKI52_26145 [marine bacterium AO1-C]